MPSATADRRLHLALQRRDLLLYLLDPLLDVANDSVVPAPGVHAIHVVAVPLEIAEAPLVPARLAHVDIVPRDVLGRLLRCHAPKRHPTAQLHTLLGIERQRSQVRLLSVASAPAPLREAVDRAGGLTRRRAELRPLKLMEIHQRGSAARATGHQVGGRRRVAAEAQGHLGGAPEAIVPLESQVLQLVFIAVQGCDGERLDVVVDRLLRRRQGHADLFFLQPGKLEDGFPRVEVVLALGVAHHDGLHQALELANAVGVAAPPRVRDAHVPEAVFMLRTEGTDPKEAQLSADVGHAGEQRRSRDHPPPVALKLFALLAHHGVPAPNLLHLVQADALPLGLVQRALAIPRQIEVRRDHHVHVGMVCQQLLGPLLDRRSAERRELEERVLASIARRIKAAGRSRWRTLDGWHADVLLDLKQPLRQERRRDNDKRWLRSRLIVVVVVVVVDIVAAAAAAAAARVGATASFAEELLVLQLGHVHQRHHLQRLP
eukprot:scaffold388_cov244-Pinguiococcus_pyrenoidosus.AAC.36